MAARVPHSDFDALFVMHNLLRRRLDAALGKQGLTLTSLQVLTAVGEANEHRRPLLSAHLVQLLGLTKGTVSVVVKQLTAKGWVAEKEAELWVTRNRPLALTRVGRQRMHAGLVVREDVLDDFSSLLNSRDRTSLMRIAGSVVAKVSESQRASRREAQIGKFKHHKTKAYLRHAWADE